MGQTILITGVAGNLGSKVATHFRSGDFDVRGLDRIKADDVVLADLAEPSADIAKAFDGVDVVFHFAGVSWTRASWADVRRNGVDVTMNVLRMARDAGVRRVVLASSNQVLLGHRFNRLPLGADTPPSPINPYGFGKLFNEEAGRAFARETGISLVALRIGDCRPGDNPPPAHPGSTRWIQEMWLSNRDLTQMAQRLVDDDSVSYGLFNLVSDNAGMRWVLEDARQAIGYLPLDHSTPVISLTTRLVDWRARMRRITPGQWLTADYRSTRG